MIELVAEIGLNANGDVSIAKELIDIVAAAGFDYVKFQKRTLEACYTKAELDTPRESPWGTTTREQKIGIEFTIDQYREIDEYCKGKIPWFASAWDVKSIFHVQNLGSCFLKIPSALITDLKFINLCVESSDLPIIISTGMSDSKMIRKALAAIPRGRRYAMLHCTSTYPSKPEEQNLMCIPRLKEQYPSERIGFSNHSPSVIYMIAAMVLGAEMIEVHVTLDKSMYGSDQAASIEPGGMFRLVKYARGIEKALGDGEKVIYNSEIPIIKKLRRKS